MAIDQEIHVATVALDDASASALSGYFESNGGFQLTAALHHYASDPGDLQLLDSLRRRPPDICIVDFDANLERARRTVENVRQVLPETVVFAISGKSDPDLIIGAMRVGCSEYLMKPLQADRLSQALSTFKKRRTERTPSRKGQLVSFLGVKGGVGVTSIAVNLACAVASMNSGRTLLIDQHPDLGDVSVYLGSLTQKNHYHFFDLVNNIHRLDEQLLNGYVVKHPSGLEVLPAPDAFGSMKIAPGTSIEGTLEFLKGIYSVIVVDCAPGLSGFNVSAIEKSERVYMVLTPDIPSIRNLARYVEHLTRFKCPPEKVHIVLNRDSKKNPISQQQIEKAIQRPISLQVPNAYNEVINSINSGQPLRLDDRTELAEIFRTWAESLVEAPAISAKPVQKKRFGILGL